MPEPHDANPTAPVTAFTTEGLPRREGVAPANQNVLTMRCVPDTHTPTPEHLVNLAFDLIDLIRPLLSEPMTVEQEIELIERIHPLLEPLIP